VRGKAGGGAHPKQRRHGRSRAEKLDFGLTTLTILLYDTGFSSSPAIRSYRKVLAAGSKALVGAARSTVSALLATLAKVDKMPMCSYSSSSPGLSNKLLYPYCALRTACLMLRPTHGLWLR